MSEQETHFGKVKEVDLYGADVEQWCKCYCIEHGTNKLDYDSWTEQYKDNFEFDEKFKVIGSKVYEVISDVEEDDAYIYRASRNSDGTINYILSFYNGGCGFEEALEDAINNMDNEQTGDANG